MLPTFGVKTGLVTGRDHILSGKNCQDAVRSAVFPVQGEQYLAAFICDGCSSGRYSEVGANLGAYYLLNQSIKLIANGLSLSMLPAILYGDLQDYLFWLLNGFPQDPAEQSLYIQDYFLFTIVGVVIGPKKTVVLNAGDGFIKINDEIIIKDYNNEPPYAAYHLVDERYLSPLRRPIPKEFEVSIRDTNSLDKIFLGSDSWIDYPNLVDELWGLNHPNAVQRKMNLWSSNQHFLQDDASAVVIEKKR